MTIAQPNRQTQLTKVLRLLFLGIAASGMVSIFFYNQMVTRRTSLREVTRLIEKLQLSNADLKNQYYAILDDKNLTNAATKLGYVKESNPKYLRLDGAVALTR